jgi:hypothetical protein
MWSWSTGLRAPGALKLGVAIALDVADFTIGRAPVLGMGFDAASAGAAVLLWGWKGAFALWELADPTEQADGFVPTHTLIAIAALRAGKGAARTAAMVPAAQPSAARGATKPDAAAKGAGLDRPD